MKYCLLIFILSIHFFIKAQAPKLIIPKGHTGKVSGVFTPDDKQFLCYGDDLSPTIWDVSSAKEVGYIKYNKRIKHSFFTKNKKSLVTISNNG